MSHYEVACAFKSRLSLSRMLARLNQVGPWDWVERCNDHWGEYIAAGPWPSPHRGSVIVLEDRRRFILNLTLTSDEPDAEAQFTSVRKVVFERIMPAIGARRLRPTNTYK